MLRSFFDCKRFINSSFIKGDIPSNKAIYSNVLKIAGPSALEMVLIGLIGSADLVMVSGLGANAISAVGITNQPRLMMMAPIMALNVGVTVLISRKKGENDSNGANMILRNSLILSVLLSLISLFIGLMFTRQILEIAGANSDYIGLAIPYFRIIIAGNFFQCIALTITAAQRGIGNTKISMKTNLSANIINIVFNYLLIYGVWGFPRLETIGDAISTAMGAVVAFILSVYSISKKDSFLYVTLRQNWKPHFESMKRVGRVALSSFTEQIFVRIGFFTFASAVAGLGTIAFATHNVCMNILSLTFSIGEGLSIASSSLVGQNLGKRRPDLSMIYSKALQRIGTVVSIAICFLIAIFRTPILMLFAQGDADIIRTGNPIMLIVALIVAFQITQVITIGALRGAGDLKFTASLMLVSVFLVRPILTYFLSYSIILGLNVGVGLGLLGAWIAVLLDQIIRNVSSRARFKQGNWMEIQV